MVYRRPYDEKTECNISRKYNNTVSSKSGNPIVDSDSPFIDWIRVY